MRKLTDEDLGNVVGTRVQGYSIERARIKRGTFSDIDCYGIVLGKNQRGDFVTWQFHLLADESVSTYWGHYFNAENREGALRDYEKRDLNMPLFRVTIAETLKMAIGVEAEDEHDAVQIISDRWAQAAGGGCFARPEGLEGGGVYTGRRQLCWR